MVRESDGIRRDSKEQIIDDLVAECDFVIIAVGD